MTTEAQKQDPPAEPTVLIVGAGAFGVSTAYHLAHAYADPTRVTLLDREPSPPPRAAAVDASRVVRADYPSALYCDLANEAMHAWYWSPELGPHYHKVGRLLLDERGSDLRARTFATLRARGTHLMQDVALGGDVARGGRWGAATEGTETDGFGSAYFNPDAGWVDAARATARFTEAAVRKGVRRVVGDVAELVVVVVGDGEDATAAAAAATGRGRVRGVKTADGKYWTADKIVLAAGAWTSALLSPAEDALGVGEADRVERQARATALVSAYVRVSDEDVGSMTRVGDEMPCVIYGRVGEVTPAWKGVGLLKYNNAETKIVNSVTTASGRKISVPPPPSSAGGSKSGGGGGDEVPEYLKQRTEALLTSRLLPKFARGKRPERWRMCWDSRTPTEDLLLCEHPKVNGLYLITGGSFCGYKFMPNIGKYMLNVLSGLGNGPEKDLAWGWKTGAQLAAAGGLQGVTRELRDLDASSQSSSRL